MYVTLVKLDKNDENLLHTSMIGVCLGTQLGTIVEWTAQQNIFSNPALVGDVCDISEIRQE